MPLHETLYIPLSATTRGQALPQPSQPGPRPAQPVQRGECPLGYGLAPFPFPVIIPCLIAFQGLEQQGMIHAQRHIPSF